MIARDILVMLVIQLEIIVTNKVGFISDMCSNKFYFDIMILLHRLIPVVTNINGVAIILVATKAMRCNIHYSLQLLAWQYML